MCKGFANHAIKTPVFKHGVFTVSGAKKINSSDIPVYMVGKQKRVMVKDFEVFLKGGRAHGINT